MHQAAWWGVALALLGGCGGNAAEPDLVEATVLASAYTGYRYTATTTLARGATVSLCSAGDATTTCNWEYTIASEPPVWADAEAVARWNGAQHEADAVAVFTRAGATRTESVVLLGASTPRVYGPSALQNGNRVRTDGALSVPVAIVDYGSFALRGIVEGFYGTPYSHAERARVIRCLASLKGNTYLYAPKGDRFLHSRWREPYPADELAHLARVNDFAMRHGMHFLWGIAPGAVDDQKKTIRFSDATDRAAFLAKIDAMHAIGIRDFALLFDDIRLDLEAVDAAVYTSPAHAHAELANDLYAHVQSYGVGSRLLFVGLAYSDLFDGWQSYTDVLGATLAPGIDVMWTGPNTFSKTLAAADFTSVTTSLGRAPILWDNYPTETIKPIDRAADLPTAIGGFLSNPMLNEYGFRGLGEFIKVLGPIARYQWNANSDWIASYDAWNDGALAAACGLESSP